MIRSFGSKDTERIWHQHYVKRIDRAVQRATLRKLELIHAAKDVDGPACSSRQPSGTSDRQPPRATQHSSKRAMAALFRLERRRRRRCRTHRLPLRLTGSIPSIQGEILLEDFINGFGLTQHKLAVSIGVPPRRINEIVHGKRADHR
jgi:hypothetical protein